MPKGELRTEGKKRRFRRRQTEAGKAIAGPGPKSRFERRSMVTGICHDSLGETFPRVTDRWAKRNAAAAVGRQKKKKEKTRKGKREGKPRQRRRRVRWSKPPFMGLGFRFFLRFLPSSCAFISGCHCFVLLRGRLSRGLCPAHRLGNLEVMLPLLSKTARAKQENERSFLAAFMFSIPGGKPYGFIVVYRRSGGDEEGKFIPLRRCGF